MGISEGGDPGIDIYVYFLSFPDDSSVKLRLRTSGSTSAVPGAAKFPAGHAPSPRVGDASPRKGTAACSTGPEAKLVTALRTHEHRSPSVPFAS